MNQSRIWPPSLDNMAVPTISVHQVSPLQQTLRMPDHRDTSSSKRCNISNRTTPMPSRSITHLTRAMCHLNLDQLSTVRGEALGRVIFLNIIMALFLKHEANGHLPCLAILHTGSLLYHIHRMARKRIVSPEPRYSSEAQAGPDQAGPIATATPSRQYFHSHSRLLFQRPKHELSNFNDIYPYISIFTIEPQASNHVQHHSIIFQHSRFLILSP